MQKYDQDFTDADYIVSNEVSISSLFSYEGQSFLNFDARRFLTDVIFKHVNGNAILGNMDRLYLLYTTRDSHDLLKEGEFSFMKMLSEPELHRCDYGAIVFGWCLLDTSHDEEIVAIDLFETLVPGHNFGALMLSKIRDKFHKCVLPRTPISSAVEYWKRVCDEDFWYVRGIKDEAYFRKTLHWPLHMIKAMSAKHGY